MKKKKLSEGEIDKIVTEESEDMSKWDDPLSVKPRGAISLVLSSEIIKEAQYLSKLHNYKRYQEWLKKIIEERITTEKEILTAFEKSLKK